MTLGDKCGSRKYKILSCCAALNSNYKYWCVSLASIPAKSEPHKDFHWFVTVTVQVFYTVA